MNYAPPKNNRRRQTREFLIPRPDKDDQPNTRTFSYMPTSTIKNLKGVHGDICVNTKAVLNEPWGWQCIKSGDPGTWVELKLNVGRA